MKAETSSKSSDTPFPLEPIHVTIPVGCYVTGDSRSEMYQAIKNGEVEAVKKGKRTLLVYESLKHRPAKRPRAVLHPIVALEKARAETARSRRRKRAKGAR
jgi:hypothetical protein